MNSNFQLTYKHHFGIKLSNSRIGKSNLIKPRHIESMCDMYTVMTIYYDDSNKLSKKMFCYKLEGFSKAAMMWILEILLSETKYRGSRILKCWEPFEKSSVRCV